MWFIKIGGGTKYGAPHQQYGKKAHAMETKPQHRFRGPRLALSDELEEILGERFILGEGVEIQDKQSTLLSNNNLDNQPVAPIRSASEVYAQRKGKVVSIALGAIGKFQVDESKFPLLCKLKRNTGDNFISQHIIDGLLIKIVSLVGTSDRFVDYINSCNSKSYRLVNVPKHDNDTAFYKLARHQDSHRVESLLDFLSGNLNEKKHAAECISTYLGNQYKDEVSAVAEAMSLCANKKMPAVAFHTMPTAINANISQQQGIKRHLHDLFGQRMFQVDMDLKGKVTKKVVEPIHGVFNYAKPVLTKQEYSQ
jgi:hypothetical protein